MSLDPSKRGKTNLTPGVARTPVQSVAPVESNVAKVNPTKPTAEQDSGDAQPQVVLFSLAKCFQMHLWTTIMSHMQRQGAGLNIYVLQGHPCKY